MTLRLWKLVCKIRRCWRSMGSRLGRWFHRAYRKTLRKGKNQVTTTMKNLLRQAQNLIVFLSVLKLVHSLPLQPFRHNECSSLAVRQQILSAVLKNKDKCLALCQARAHSFRSGQWGCISVHSMCGAVLPRATSGRWLLFMFCSLSKLLCAYQSAVIPWAMCVYLQSSRNKPFKVCQRKESFQCSFDLLSYEEYLAWEGKEEKTVANFTNSLSSVQVAWVTWWHFQPNL